MSRSNVARAIRNRPLQVFFVFFFFCFLWARTSNAPHPRFSQQLTVFLFIGEFSTYCCALFFCCALAAFRLQSKTIAAAKRALAWWCEAMCDKCVAPGVGGSALLRALFAHAQRTIFGCLRRPKRAVHASTTPPKTRARTQPNFKKKKKKRKPKKKKKKFGNGGYVRRLTSGAQTAPIVQNGAQQHSLFATLQRRRVRVPTRYSAAGNRQVDSEEHAHDRERVAQLWHHSKPWLGESKKKKNIDFMLLLNWRACFILSSSIFKFNQKLFYSIIKHI